jgi:hypothetical protein
MNANAMQLYRLVAFVGHGSSGNFVEFGIGLGDPDLRHVVIDRWVLRRHPDVSVFQVVKKVSGPSYTESYEPFRSETWCVSPGESWSETQGVSRGSVSIDAAVRRKASTSSHPRRRGKQ